MKIETELRKGCRLSSTLFNVYMNEFVAELEKKGLGLRLTAVPKEGHHECIKTLFLAFADDLVLLAESEWDMQHLLDVCAQVAHRDGFKFDMSKNQWVAFNTAHKTSFHIGEQRLEETTEYTELGVKI